MANVENTLPFTNDQQPNRNELRPLEIEAGGIAVLAFTALEIGGITNSRLVQFIGGGLCVAAFLGATGRQVFRPRHY